MKILNTLHKRLLLLFVITIVALVVHGLFSMDSMLAEQSRAQQKTLNPAVDLITENLTRPLHISQTIAKSTDLLELMQARDFDDVAKTAYLQTLESRFGMSFFLASEAARKQVNADGSRIELIEGEVNWYFKYKELADIVNADIGKWEDVHFYIDVKVFDDEGRFLGFVGVAKRLAEFLETFERFRTDHGFEFFFVNAQGDIMLASDSNLNPNKRNFEKIQTLAWYKKAAGLATFTDSNQPAQLHNKLVLVDEKEYMISQFSVANFDWELYLVAPILFKPSPYNLTYLTVSVMIVIIISILFASIYRTLNSLNKQSNSGSLTLPSGYLCSDEMIKSIVQYNTYKKPSHLLMLKVIMPESGVLSLEKVIKQDTISSRVSSRIMELFPNATPDNLVGKIYQNQWVFLFQDTSYAVMNQHIKEIKYALETLQVDLEKQAHALDYFLVDFELNETKDFATLLYEFESQFEDSLDP